MNITTFIKKAKQLCPEYDETVTIYLIEKGTGKPSDTDINRIGGNPIGVSNKTWPSLEGVPMTHLITIDLNSVPKLKAKFPEDVRALALFASDPMNNEADCPETDETKVMHLKASDMNQVPSRFQPFNNEDEGAIPANTFRCHAVDVPNILFTEAIYDIHETDENNPICKLRNALLGSPMMGGSPMWLQYPEHDGEIVLQFDEDFINMNLGDVGIMYVFTDVAFWQCC